MIKLSQLSSQQKDISLLPIILGCILIPLFFIFSVIGFFILLDYFDKPIVQARINYPLDKKHSYIIIPSDLFRNTGPLVYGIIKPGEATSAAALAWRRVGSSTIDLKDYVNKKVIIEGKWEIGKPMLLQDVKSNLYGLLDNQPVIHIEGIQKIVNP